MSIFQKSAANPVLGRPETGSFFDPYVAWDGEKFRMDFSYRAEKALAVTEDERAKAAELALIVNRYTSLLKEKQDRELTFSILKRESTVNHYNREVLKQLEEILRAEQILENIK